MNTAKKMELPDFDALNSFFKPYSEYKRIPEKDELKEIWHNLSFLPRFIHYLENVDFDYFRARPADDVKQDITLLSTFSHPPTEKTSQDRANIKGHPVLYTSLNENTSLIESKCKDYFYLGVWNLEENSGIKLNSFLFTKLDNENPMKIISDDLYKKMNEMFKGLSINQLNDIKKLYTLFSELFIRNNKIITSLIGYKILYQNEFEKEIQPDAIVYPSIQVDKKGCNFAFHPDFVKNNLRLNYIFFGKINSFNDQNFDINLTFKNFGININDKIKWYRLRILIDEVNIYSSSNVININEKNINNYNVALNYKMPLLNFCDFEISKNKLNLFKTNLKNLNALCKKSKLSLSDKFTLSATYDLFVDNKFQIHSKEERYDVSNLEIKYHFDFSKKLPKIE